MNPLALEAQVVRELSPVDTVRAAAAAGFDHVGIWIDPIVWTPALSAAVRTAFADAGIAPLDAEVIRLSDSVAPDQLRLIDIAAEIGIPHIIVAGFGQDRAGMKASLETLCVHAGNVGTGLVLEFGRFSSVPTMAEAIAMVVDMPVSVGILPDPIHLERSDGAAADLATIPPGLVPFAQICDAGRAPEDKSAAALLDEARFHRLDLGEGTLPLADYVGALPASIPLSNEVRSRAIEQTFPDPFDRARMLAGTMRRALARWNDSQERS